MSDKITAQQVRDAWREANVALTALELAQKKYIDAYNWAAKIDAQ